MFFPSVCCTVAIAPPLSSAVVRLRPYPVFAAALGVLDRERAAKEARLQALRARLDLYEKDRVAEPMDGQVGTT